MKVNVSFMKANQSFQNETKLEMGRISNSKGKKINKVIYFNWTELHARNLFLITHLNSLGSNETGHILSQTLFFANRRQRRFVISPFSLH